VDGANRAELPEQREIIRTCPALSTPQESRCRTCLSVGYGALNCDYVSLNHDVRPVQHLHEVAACDEQSDVTVPRGVHNPDVRCRTVEVTRTSAGRAAAFSLPKGLPPTRAAPRTGSPPGPTGRPQCLQPLRTRRPRTPVTSSRARQGRAMTTAIDREAAIDALDAGRPPSSAGERRILRPSASVRPSPA
jgi:hypothetical protein